MLLLIDFSIKAEQMELRSTKQDSEMDDGYRRPKKCYFCGKKFKYEMSLKTHQKEFHLSELPNQKFEIKRIDDEGILSKKAFGIRTQLATINFMAKFKKSIGPWVEVKNGLERNFAHVPSRI